MTDSPAPKRKPRTSTLLGTLNKSVRAGSWLTPADAATIQLARSIAGLLDAQLATHHVCEECGCRYNPDRQLVARFLDTLKALGLTAISRKDLGQDKARKEDSSLANVRSIAPSANRFSRPAHLHAVTE